MKEISKTKLSVYASLGTGKMRRRHGLFTVEGERAVTDSLGTFRAEAILCEGGVPPKFDTHGVECLAVTSEQMRKLSNLSTHSSVLAVFHLPDTQDISFNDLPSALYMVLDGVQDPGNLGTIIRTCHWFGVRRIFASRDTVDLFNPKTIQSTMGSFGKVDITYCDLAELFKSNPRLPVYGTLLAGEDIFTADIAPGGAMLVMGNEGNGISPQIREMITHPVTIPPKNNDDHSESLNVAIAAAVALSVFYRK